MNGKFLLDTNIVIAFLRGDESVTQRPDATDQLFVSCTAIGELFYGTFNFARDASQFVHGLQQLVAFGAQNRAAIVAGPSPNTTKVVAAKLLKHPLVFKAVGNAQPIALDKLGLTRETILREMAYCALRDPSDLCDENGVIAIDDLRKLPEGIRRCADGFKCRQGEDKVGDVHQTIELKLTSKLKALALAMQHFGLLNEKP